MFFYNKSDVPCFSHLFARKGEEREREREKLIGIKKSGQRLLASKEACCVNQVNVSVISKVAFS